MISSPRSLRLATIRRANTDTPSGIRTRPPVSLGKASTTPDLAELVPRYRVDRPLLDWRERPIWLELGGQEVKFALRVPKAREQLRAVSRRVSHRTAEGAMLDGGGRDADRGRT